MNKDRSRICQHWEKGKERIEGSRLGRCTHGKPVLSNAPFDQFEENCIDCNCPSYEPNASLHGRAPARTVQGVVGSLDGDK